MNLRMLYEWNVKPFIHRNEIILSDESRKIKKNRVNLHYYDYKFNAEGEFHNLGDWLSPIIVSCVLKDKDLSLDTPTKKTRNLYAIGSIIGFGYQNTTIWGSGLITPPPDRTFV